MRIEEFYKIANALAPKPLSDEYCAKYDAYDNSGILVDTGEEIKGVLFSLDLSFAAIEKAKSLGANLIVTHHPAIYGKIGAVRVSDFQPLGKKLADCLKNGISVLSMHLNLDAANGGIDESLMDGILRSTGAGMRSTQDVSMMHPLSQGGYGRVYDVQEIAFPNLLENIKKEFHSERVLTYGDTNRSVKKVASFCGGGADEEAVAFAVANGADVIVSSDFKHHVITLALETGINVLALTHYASENYGFKKYYEKIRRQIEIPCGYHTDEGLL